MFSSYSWSGFLWFTVFAAGTYYVFIGWLYYRKDIYHFLFYKRNLLKEAVAAPVKETPDHLQKVHELITELGQIIRTASEETLSKPEMLFAMKQRIRNFLILESTQYKGKITGYILGELEIYGIQGIDSAEIENLWKP